MYMPDQLLGCQYSKEALCVGNRGALCAVPTNYNYLRRANNRSRKPSPLSRRKLTIPDLLHNCPTSQTSPLSLHKVTSPLQSQTSPLPSQTSPLPLHNCPTRWSSRLLRCEASQTSQASPLSLHNCPTRWSSRLSRCKASQTSQASPLSLHKMTSPHQQATPLSLHKVTIRSSLRNRRCSSRLSWCSHSQPCR